jgi:hypothetical protein
MIMRNPYVKLVVALFTFSLALGITLSYRALMPKMSNYVTRTDVQRGTIKMSFTYTSSPKSMEVNKRLSTAIQSVEIERLETYLQSGVIEATCQSKGLSAEECSVYKDGYRAARISYINERVSGDIQNATKGCYDDKLSEAQCIARKEMAARDIEENMLGK